MNTADFIASGCAVAVRTGVVLRAGITGSLRTSHLADSYLMRAEVHGGGLANTHLCMAIPNTTYYECLVDSVPARRSPEVNAAGMVVAPTGPGIGYEHEWQTHGAPEALATLLVG
jgi:L-alanine-DL-glutamate epimerase-like enolase superfamily enzyme